MNNAEIQAMLDDIADKLNTAMRAIAKEHPGAEWHVRPNGSTASLMLALGREGWDPSQVVAETRVKRMDCSG